MVKMVKLQTYNLYSRLLKPGIYSSKYHTLISFTRYCFIHDRICKVIWDNRA